MPIDFSPTTSKGTISLPQEGQNAANASNPQVTNWDADRISYAMGDQSPGPATVAAYLTLGNERVLRQGMAQQQALDQLNKRTSLLTQLAQNAGKMNRSLTPEETQYLQSINSTPITADPGTSVEKDYAKKLAGDTTAQSNPDDSDPSAKPVYDMLQRQIANQEIAKTALVNAQQVISQENGFEKMGDALVGFIPFMNNAAMTSDENGNIQSVGELLNPGGTLEKEYDSTLQLPPDQFKQYIDTKVQNLQKNYSKTAAVQWLQGFLGYSTEDAAYTNIGQAADALGIAAPVIGKSIKGLAGVAKLNAAGPLDSVGRKVAVGNIEGAAEETAANVISRTKVNSNISQKIAQQSVKIQQEAPGWLNSTAYISDPGTLSAERANRIVNAISENQSGMASLLDTGNQINPMNRATIQALMDDVKTNILPKHYGALNDAIVNLEYVPPKTFGDVPSWKATLGKTDALSFKTPEQATYFAKKQFRLPDGSFNVEQTGNNWFVTIQHPLDETSDIAQRMRISTDNTQNMTFKDAILGDLEAPDYYLSDFENGNRKILAYGSNKAIEDLRKPLRGFEKANKKERQALSVIIDEARRIPRKVVQPDGKVETVFGKYYGNVGELEQAYLARHNRLPSDREITNYFAYKDLNDADYESINRRELRDKSRLGVEQHQFVYTDDKGKFQTSPWFEGKVVDSLPNVKERDYTILWTGNKGKPKLSLASRMSKADRESLAELLKNGKITRVFDPRDANLQQLESGSSIDYVVSGSRKTKPLNDIQVKYTEGGHQIYPVHGLYLKQAQVRPDRFGRRIFDGDFTAFQFNIPKVGEQAREGLENVREALLRGANDAELEDLLHNSPFDSVQDIRNSFYDSSKKIDKTNPRATFDIRSPFVLVKNGQHVSDVVNLGKDGVFGERFVDPTDEAGLQSKVSVPFTQPRSDPVLTMANKGTQANPVWKVEPAKFLDPYQTLRATVNDLVRSRYAEDYAHQSLEDAALRWGHLLKAGKDQAFANPIAKLLQADDKAWAANADWAEVRKAKVSIAAIKHLLNQGTSIDRRWFEWMEAKLINSLYKHTSQEYAENFLKPWQWGNQTSPSKVLAGLAYHKYLGLFNPIQWFKQGQSVAQSMMIDGNPLRTAKSPGVYSYLSMRSITPDASVPALTKAASKALGIKTDDLEDIYQHWIDSGFAAREGQYGSMNNLLGSDIFRGKVSAFLDAGQMFFRGGNNINRGISYTLSHLEFLERHPFFKDLPSIYNETVAQRIAQRADILYTNMSKASVANWQHGIANIPLQFFGFQWRLAEQLLQGTLGGRGMLTAAEKLRLLTGNAFLYGMPVAAGIALPIWPAAESIRQYAMQNGIVDADAVTTALMDGIPALLTKMFTGDRIDVGGSYGPGGNTFLQELLSNEPNWWSIGGAGPGAVGQLLDAAMPFYRAARSVFDTSDDDHWNLTQDDFIAVAQQVPVVDKMTKAIGILNSGKWRTHGNANVVAQVAPDWTNAIATAIGMTPQEVTDSYLMSSSVAARNAAMTAYRKIAQQQYSIGLQYMADGNLKMRDTYWARAHAAMIEGGFRPDQVGSEFISAVKQKPTLFQQALEAFQKQNPDLDMSKYEQESQH